MKGKGQGWKGESRRHSMARKGITTARGKTFRERVKEKDTERIERGQRNYIKSRIQRIQELSQNPNETHSVHVKPLSMKEVQTYFINNMEENNVNKVTRYILDKFYIEFNNGTVIEVFRGGLIDRFAERTEYAVVWADKE